MSMEAILDTTAAHAPNFDPAFAMGRIHSILSALIQYCRTRAAYLYTGCFTCELHIRPGGTALVPPVEPNSEAKMELLRVWRIVQEMDVPSVALISRPSHPVLSEPHHLQLVVTTGPFIPPDGIQPVEQSPAPLLSRTIIVPFALYISLNICYNVFWRILPIATLIFQIVFFLHFAVFALILSVMSCMIVLASC